MNGIENIVPCLKKHDTNMAWIVCMQVNIRKDITKTEIFSALYGASVTFRMQ